MCSVQQSAHSRKYETKQIKNNFERGHFQFVEIVIAFFKRKEAALKNTRIDSSGYLFQSETEAGLEAS